MSDVATLPQPLPVLVFDDPDWHQSALCAQIDQDDCYPETGASPAAAKERCNTLCPVKDDCLRDALLNDERWGVWGGLTAKERDKQYGRPFKRSHSSAA